MALMLGRYCRGAILPKMDPHTRQLLALMTLVGACAIALAVSMRFALKSARENRNVPPSENAKLSSPGFRLAQQQCSRCHLLPEPAHLPKEAWPFALTWMGNYLGFPNTMGPYAPIVVPELAPALPLVTDAQLKQISEYYISNAPTQTELVAMNDKTKINTDLGIFDVEIPTIISQPNNLVTLVHIDASAHHTYVATCNPPALDDYDEQWHSGWHQTLPTQAVRLAPSKNGFFLDLIGDFNADRLRGEVLGFTMENGNIVAQTPLVEHFHRLTQHQMADLDGDGYDDLLLVAFGDYAIGQVSIRWGQADGNLSADQILVTRSGALNAVVRDFDGDGKPDILLLMTQGKNELLHFHNLGQRQFDQQQLREWPSSFGFNHMSMADVDGDGRLDLILVNGNNMENPEPPLRSYHGIHVLSNRGGVTFEETYFYPMFGAMQAIATDLNGDGLCDIAAISFYPDWSAQNPETFTWLEQTAKGAFVPHTLASSHIGRWLTMDIGDLDGDGRPDIVLGGGYLPIHVPTVQRQRYRELMERAPSVLVLHNHRNSLEGTK